MSDLEKLADLFERNIDEQDIFGKVKYREEARKLSLFAGMMKNKSEKEQDPVKSQKLLEVAKLVLMAGDMLKNL
jgi:hypothetical protein